MNIFEYYKKISSELNNNVTYEVLSIGKEYCFVSIDVKEFDSEYKEEVYDVNGILIGYKFEEFIYETLPNEIQEQVSFLTDVIIKGTKDDIR